ncbi:MAG: hypothetical protein KGR68_03720 [Betaproteobacteria bacterium]|nr:hypothetical protein [Betaproteobacteria bacterium]
MSETAQPGASDGAPEIDVDTTASAAPPDNASPAGSEETDAEDAGADTPPKRSGGVQKRIDELTELRRQAERDRDHWRQLAMQQAQPRAPEPGAAPADAPLPPDLAQAVGPAPDPSKFAAGEYDPEYIRAAARYDVRVDQARMVAHQRQAQAQHAQAQFGAKVRTIMQDAVAADPAVEAIILAPDFPMAAHVVHALTDAENPGALLAHLAKNAGEVTRISKLSPLAAARELGKIEARLSAAPVAPARPSAAPPPPRPVRGSGVAPPDMSAMTYEQYRALRMGQAR